MYTRMDSRRNLISNNPVEQISYFRSQIIMPVLPFEVLAFWRT